MSCVCAVLGSLLMAGDLRASAVATTSSRDVTPLNCQLSLRARRAFLQDIVLKTLNLGVSVRGNVATVWGPVPSEAVGRRAVAALQQVPGVGEVRNQLSIESPDDPLVEWLNQPTPKGQTSVVESLVTTEPPSGVLIRAPLEVEPKAAPPASIPVMPSIAIPKPPAAIPAPAAQLQAPVAITPPVPLPEAVEKLRQADPRFQRIQCDVEGGLVRVRGVVTRWEDLFVLANSISRLPGVERVILVDVQTPQGANQPQPSKRP